MTTTKDDKNTKVFEVRVRSVMTVANADQLSTAERDKITLHVLEACENFFSDMMPTCSTVCGGRWLTPEEFAAEPQHGKDLFLPPVDIDAGPPGPGDSIN